MTAGEPEFFSVGAEVPRRQSQLGRVQVRPVGVVVLLLLLVVVVDDEEVQLLQVEVQQPLFHLLQPQPPVVPVLSVEEVVVLQRELVVLEVVQQQQQEVEEEEEQLEAEEEEYFLEDLTPGESYEFQVRSDCEEEESAYSEPFEFTMIAEQETCGLPLIMNFFIPDDEILWVTWNEVPDAESYRLRYRVADSGEDWVVTEVEDEIFAELEGLENNTNYEIQVRVRCTGGWPDYSESEFFFMSTEDETVASDPSPAAFDFTFQLYPNPAQGAVNVVADLPRTGEVLLQLHDLMGRRLWRDRQQLAAGSQTLAYDWSELAAGVYFVKIRCLDSGQQLSQKLVLF